MKENGFLSLLQEVSKKKSKSIAIELNNEKITYEELNNRSNRIASYLNNHIDKNENIIGIAMHKGINQILCIIGIMKAGKTYLPIDLSYPQNRITYILENSNVKSIMVEEKNLFPDTNNMNYVIYSDTQEEENIIDNIKFPKYAYSMYTSGSTGNPKGNLIKYDAASNLINWQIKQSSKAQSSYCKTLQLAPISFDVSFQEIFSTLCIGGTLEIVDENTRIDFTKVFKMIEKKNISRIYMPPVYLNEIANISKGKELAYVKEIIVAGEQLKITDSIRQFFKVNKDCRLINQYGPTETHVVTSYTLDKNVDKWDYHPLIGKEIDNVKVYILDEDLQEVPDGTWGELYIQGICVTGSYMNNEVETKKRYITFKNGEKIYKTGDICKRVKDGNIEYSSRADDQVKIRGFRVELSEIEKNILDEKSIKNCAVVVKEDKFGGKILEAFISMKKYEQNKISVIQDKVKKYLIKTLPEYMVPRRITIMEKLPLSPNGKIDKKKLLEVDNNKKEKITKHENDIKEIYKEILGIDEIDGDGNFFELGGTSILANRFISEINEKLELNKAVVDLYENPTFNKFISSLESSDIVVEESKFSKQTSDEDIAIIGMACKFPNADNPEEFWNMLKEKNKEGTKNTPLKGIQNFEPDLFKISPKEAKLMDPQIRIFLQCVWKMFEDAGYNPFDKKMNAGVFAGCGVNTYLLNNLRNQIDQEVNLVNSMKNLQILYNNDKDYIATKTSYIFNLTGPSINVQSACSTSLVALHLACQSIHSGECEYAIAGASTIVLPNNNKYKYTEDMVFSKDGNCNAFDENASGTVFSNGVGCILLKPLSKAIADGDNIHAIIKGTAVNNDGNDKVGFSAPSVSGQADVIKKALKKANIKPEEVEYIEAHGTATKVGDEIEVKALKKAYKTEKRNYCALGSLKNDIGHTAWSSGIASIIKVVMAIKNKKIPPMNNFKRENENLNLADSPFYINKRLKNWKSTSNKRTAAVSSFGLGGTNSHVIIQEYDKHDQTKEENAKQWNILTLSASNESSLKKIIQNYYKKISEDESININNLCYTANVGRRKLKYRAVYVFKDRDDLLNKLQLENVKIIDSERNKNKVIFLFSGNGTQYTKMCMDLYKNNEIFKKYFDKCEKTFYNLTKKSILEMINNTDQNWDIELSQIAIFSAEYALYNYWKDLGIKPDLMIGHSLGEYAVACCTGIFSIEDTMKLLIARGKILKKLGNKLGMISVRLPENKIKGILQDKNIDLSISVVNTKELTVLSGRKSKIAKISKILTNLDVQYDILDIQTAGHTAELKKYLPEFKKILKTVEFNEPKTEIISTVTGKIGSNQLGNINYWCKHLVKPVQFYKAIKNLKGHENNVVIEIGTNPTLLNLAMEELGDSNIWLTSLRKGKNDTQQILLTIAQMYSNGIDVDYSNLYQNCKKISLPTYEFQNIRYWYDYEPKVDVLSNLYEKMEEEKELCKNSINENGDYIIFYNEDNKEQVREIGKKLGKHTIYMQMGNKNKIINNTEILIDLTTSNLEKFIVDSLAKKRYNIVFFMKHFNVFKEDNVDLDKINNECMLYLKMINILNNAGLVSKFYHIDIAGKNKNENEVIKNIFISLIQVAEMEFSDIKFFRLFINDNNSFNDLIINELLYSSDELVIYQNKKRYIHTIKHAESILNSNVNKIDKEGIYILTGGLGGIGKLITKWLAEKNVKKIILMNRRIPTDAEITEIKLLEEKYNTCINIEKVNVVHYDEIEKFIKSKLKNNLNQVRGIFHLAGVINDATINKISAEQMKQVLKPKIIGTWNLHLLSKKYFKKLEIFNLFSSAAAFVGNAGQVNHAVANSFLDSMVKIRLEERLPVSSINWGTWDKVGHLAIENKTMERLLRKGFKTILPQLGLASLEYIIENNLKHVAVLPINWNTYVEYHHLKNKNLYKNMIEAETTDVVNHKLDSNSQDKEITDVEQYISNTIENILGIKINNPDESLIKMGLDSLSSIEIRNKFQSDLKISLEANFVYKNSTLNKIIENIKEQTNRINNEQKSNDTMKPSCQQSRWLKLIEDNYGERVVPIIFTEKFNEQIFKQSIRNVLERHISLRWYFPNSKIKEISIDEVMSIHEPIVYDFSKDSKTKKIENVSNLILDMFKNMPSPYERISWMLKVVVLEEKKFAILLGVQHLDFDGSSISTFSKEFSEFYQHYMYGKELAMAPSIGYDKYIEWQNNYIETKMPYDREFFKGLYGMGKITLLPNTNIENLCTPCASKKITKIKEKDYLEKIDKIAGQINVTRFSVILSAYAKFVSWLVGENIVSIAAIVNGRSRPEFKNIIGPFSAPFPLKICVGKDIDNKELIEACNNEIMEINSRSVYPVADFTQTIPNYMNLPIQTYFTDVGINYTNYKPKSEKNSEGDFKIIEILSQVKEEEFKIFNSISFKRVESLHLVINELKESLAFNFYYHTEKYDEKTINMWIDKFFDFLNQMVDEV